MTDKEKKLALYCLKASSDYYSEVCEGCINYPNCDHTGQDDVTETIIKALEQEPKTGHWIYDDEYSDWFDVTYECSCCKRAIIVPYDAKSEVYRNYPYCHCGARMIGSIEK